MYYLTKVGVYKETSASIELDKVSPFIGMNRNDNLQYVI